MGILGGTIKVKGTEEIFEAKMTENFPKLMLDINHRSRKLTKVGYLITLSLITIPRHIIQTAEN